MPRNHVAGFGDRSALLNAVREVALLESIQRSCGTGLVRQGERLGGASVNDSATSKPANVTLFGGVTS
jgi:hypothetical protein